MCIFFFNNVNFFIYLIFIKQWNKTYRNIIKQVSSHVTSFSMSLRITSLAGPILKIRGRKKHHHEGHFHELGIFSKPPVAGNVKIPFPGTRKMVKKNKLAVHIYAVIRINALLFYIVISLLLLVKFYAHCIVNPRAMNSVAHLGLCLGCRSRAKST